MKEIVEGEHDRAERNRILDLRILSETNYILTLDNDEQLH